MTTAEAMRRHRSKPENRAKGQLIVSARSAALADLAAMYPADYERLCNEQRAKVGLPPLGAARGRPSMRLMRLLEQLPDAPAEAAVG